MPGKKVTCYTCAGSQKIKNGGKWVSCNTCGGSGLVSTR